MGKTFKDNKKWDDWRNSEKSQNNKKDKKFVPHS